VLLHVQAVIQQPYPYLLASTEATATAAHCQTLRDALPGGGTGPSLSVYAAAALFHLLAMAPGRQPPVDHLTLVCSLMSSLGLVKGRVAEQVELEGCDLGPGKKVKVRAQQHAQQP
jgi:hypothetical protein